ncbi:hypothetical protein [Rhodanobacter sp. OR444]|uniref:hypothetical protein n=1 Tax=Rhodanobacter sp. OR444 TaxID=1076525 RepID=UPI00210089E1|nr:hypothetical protein [Rhodanobacter sp. OR444]
MPTYCHAKVATGFPGTRGVAVSTVVFHHDSGVVQGFLRFSRVAALLIFAVALIALARWWNWPLLTTAWPDQAAMTASAAIGFVLSDISPLAGGGADARWLRLGRGL